MKLDQTVGLAAHCILIARDGQEAAIEDSAAPIHDKDGRLTGGVIVFRNVGVALVIKEFRDIPDCMCFCQSRNVLTLGTLSPRELR